MRKGIEQASRPLKESTRSLRHASRLAEKPLKESARSLRRAARLAEKPFKAPRRPFRRMMDRVTSSINHRVDTVADHFDERVHISIERSAKAASEEIARATQEVSRGVQEIGEQAAPQVVRFGLGALFGALGVVLLVVFLVQFLATLSIVPSWSGYLVVGSACAIVSVVLMWRGRSRSS